MTRILREAFSATGEAAAPALPAATMLHDAAVVELHTSESSLNYYRELPAEEQALVARAVPKRQSDFGDSRWCAHRAVQNLGYTDGVILRGERGMPVFPDGVAGSITHTQGFRAALVASAQQWRSVGIDAERHRPLPPGILEVIANEHERAQLDRLAPLHADTLLFSIKETTYKTWFPVARTFLDFTDAEVTVHPDGRFESHILVADPPVEVIHGRWVVHDSLVVTFAGIPG